MRSKRQRNEKRAKQQKEKRNELLTEDEKLEQEIDDTIKTRKIVEMEIDNMKNMDKELGYEKKSEYVYDESDFDELENIRIIKFSESNIRILAVEQKIIPTITTGYKLEKIDEEDEKLENEMDTGITNENERKTFNGAEIERLVEFKIGSIKWIMIMMTNREILIRL